MLEHHEIPLVAEIDALSPQPRASYTLTVPGVMRGKGRPRFSARGGVPRAFSDAKTVSAEAFIRSQAFQQVGQPCLTGPLSVDIRIEVAIPTSWSKRRRIDAAAGRVMPTGKPDLDNCLKLVSDALNGIVWGDDAQLCRAVATKAYGDVPQTVIKVEQL